MTSDRNASPLPRLLVGDLLAATLMGLVGATGLAWLQLASEGRVPGSAALLGGVLVAIIGFTLPAVLVAVPVTLAVLRRDLVGATLSTLTGVLVCAPVAAATMSAGNQLRLVLLDQAPHGLPIVTMVGDALSLLVVLLPVTWLALALRHPRPLRRSSTTRALGRARTRARAGLALVLTIVTAMSTAALTPPTAVGAPSATAASCLGSGRVDKTFDVTALDVDIPVNRFGDHDPLGKMYALTSRLGDIAAQTRSQVVSIGLRDDAIQPLVIRANQGDCIQIRFTNSASGGDFGLHIDGLEFNASSSGDAIGTNPSSAVALGRSTTYRFAIPDDARLEGGHYMHPGPGTRAAVNHGLFGALVIEPPGSTYWNASTPDQPLASGWEAIVKPAGVTSACVSTSRVATCAFREAAMLTHEIGNDNETLKDKNGADVPLQDATTGSYKPGGFAFNYRSEPFRNRLLAFPKEKAHAYSSSTFGEPATPMMRGYLGDPTKIRLMHVGAEKFHIFHLHGGGDRWRANPVADTTYNYADTGLQKDPATVLSPSQRLDSQSMGPGETFNLEIEGGAGGVQQSAGDFLYHCHIAKHYVSGMWSVWRVYDTLQPDLVPLRDRVAPPAAVESSALIGRTIDGTTITAANLDGWIRPQLPPPGVMRDSQDGSVWNWQVAGTASAPRYLGAPADPTVVPGSPQVVAGQPNLLAVDIGHIYGDRPAILFNPLNGRPAYPMLRPNIGKRPPFTAAGHSGAPWLGANAGQSATGAADPWAGRKDGLCPTGRNLRTFNVVAIAKPIPRTPTFTDPEGKIFVLAKNKAATYADPAKSDPLAIRANQGDCIAVTLTNEIPDASAFDGFSKTTMHIHHVQFDVQGSDGVTAGFAYEHSVRPYKVEDPTLAVAARRGDKVLQLSNVSKFLGTDANGQPIQPWIAAGQGLETIDIHQIASVDPVAGTVTLTSALTSDHAAGEFAGTEFIQYRWYPDVQLDNIFWHDHVDGIHGWGHGLVGQLIIEPAGSTYHDPVTGAEVDSGTLVDIHTNKALSPGLVKGSFRELALWTINDNDKGDYSTVNLKANPLVDRPDKANQFSSWTYGDPATPLPRLYPNDPLVVRTISISPTLDTLHMQGARTLLEPRYTKTNSAGGVAPEGTVIDAVHSGISEKYTLIFNGEQPDMRMRPGDYLYANGIERRTQDGAWGIARILPGTVPSLQPLPGVTAPTAPYVQPVQTGLPSPASVSAGNPCPQGAPARRFDISAMGVPSTFGGASTAYVPNADVNAINRRTKSPEPLVLHVAAGECLTVALTNLLPAADVVPPALPLPPPPVGFAVGKLDREAGSGGVNVGFAPDQNVAPGATREYVYYVPVEEIGTATIADLAGATTLKQGLYGAVVVAPASQVSGQRTSFTDPVTGAAKDIGSQVVVHVPGAATPDYRDFTVTMADDDDKIGQDFMPYPTNATAGASLINYQAAPAGDGPNSFQNPGNVPLLTAFAGDPTTVHALVAPGSENSHVFSLGGLRWDQDPFMTNSNWLTAQGMGPWETFNAKVVGGAGGTAQAPGDYFYGDLRRPFTAVGLWGIQRVLPTGTAQCPILRVDGNTCSAVNPPAAPAAPVAVAANASVTLNWAPPPSDGGSAIRSYEVLVSAGTTVVSTITAIPATATTHVVTGLTDATAYTFQVRAVNAIGAGALSPRSNQVTYRSLVGFTAATPTRILDTRDGTGAAKAPLGAGATLTLTLTGPSLPVGATAVALNVTVTNPSAASYLTIYPGTTRPTASNLNFGPGQTIPNMVQVPLNPDGTVTIYNAAGTVDVIADLVGSYGPATGSGFTATTPTRILDTRVPIGVATKAQLGARATMTLTVPNLPAGATAVAMNVTVTNPTAASWLTVYPGTTRPATSNLNFTAGQTIPNMVIVPLGPGGTVTIYNEAGTVDVIADLVGSYAPATGAGFTGTTPTRVLDTRSAIGVTTAAKLGAGATLTLALKATDVPAGATAVALNVTVTDPTAPSYLTVYPGPTRPNASNLNYETGQTIPNMVLVPINPDGTVTIYNNAGTVHVIADLIGYYK